MMLFPKLGLVLGMLAALAVASAAHDGANHVAGPADNYVYQLAAPGSYRLPVIKNAAGGIVIDQTGTRHEMHDLLAGHLTFLAFIYTRCGDICPLATMRLAELRDLAGSSKEGRLRFIVMSFDPDHDTPDKMAEFAKPWLESDDHERAPWLFLTAPSRENIAPLLSGYNQPLAPKADKGDALRPISHLMRVFLIDEQARIRNIYSPDFLDPRLMLNDLLTLDSASGS
jgi:cytochrome oxidase Cu insertion factor (SCO1/SenC/PrrC family)